MRYVYTCGNCSTTFEEDFCPDCGKKLTEKEKELGEIRTHICGNCGTEFEEDFCPDCGEEMPELE